MTSTPSVVAEATDRVCRTGEALAAPSIGHSSATCHKWRHLSACHPPQVAPPERLPPDAAHPAFCRRSELPRSSAALAARATVSWEIDNLTPQQNCHRGHPTRRASTTGSICPEFRSRGVFVSPSLRRNVESKNGVSPADSMSIQACLNLQLIHAVNIQTSDS